MDTTGPRFVCAIVNHIGPKSYHPHAKRLVAMWKFLSIWILNIYHVDKYYSKKNLHRWLFFRAVKMKQKDFYSSKNASCIIFLSPAGCIYRYPHFFNKQRHWVMVRSVYVNVLWFVCFSSNKGELAVSFSRVTTHAGQDNWLAVGQYVALWTACKSYWTMHAVLEPCASGGNQPRADGAAGAKHRKSATLSLSTGRTAPTCHQLPALLLLLATKYK